MSGPRINGLNNGIRQFAAELGRDTLASKRVEIGIVTFGGSVSPSEFVLARDFRPEELVATGDTPMGQAILTGLDLLEKRKAAYRKSGALCYRPWIFLITDGAPTDADTQQWTEAVKRIREGETETAKKFSVFCVGVAGAEFARLRELSVREPLQLDGLKFAEAFVWLSSSLGAVSRSKLDDHVQTAPIGWGTVPT
jgi:uncharacterized protein YegL